MKTTVLRALFYAIMTIGILSSCSQEKEKIQGPLTTEEIRSNFIKSVTDEVRKSPIKVDFRVEGNTLYMIDKSDTVTGLNIIEKALKEQGVWIEDPNNTLGHFGSSLMKLGFTHFVSWSGKDKRLRTDELKYKPYKKRND